MSTDSFSNGMTTSERGNIVSLAIAAHTLLLQHPSYTMSLGDFIDELRGAGIGSVMIDELIIYMSSSRMAELWRHRVTNETWISSTVST